MDSSASAAADAGAGPRGELWLFQHDEWSVASRTISASSGPAGGEIRTFHDYLGELAAEVPRSVRRNREQRAMQIRILLTLTPDSDRSESDLAWLHRCP